MRVVVVKSEMALAGSRRGSALFLRASLLICHMVCFGQYKSYSYSAIEDSKRHRIYSLHELISEPRR